MSAIPGFAIDNSVKGVSLSTTTARFIGTCSALDGAPRITCNVSATPTDGIAANAKERLVSAAVIILLRVIVTCLLDHARYRVYCPYFSADCAEKAFFARINTLRGKFYVGLGQQTHVPRQRIRVVEPC